MRIVTVLLSLGTAAILYFFSKLVLHRRKFKDLPKPPYSFFLGHIKLLTQTMSLYPPKIHPQLAITHLRQQYNLPEVFYIDIWPLNPPLMVCASLDANNAVDTQYSFGKHAQNNVVMGPLVGDNSIPAINGALWRRVHHMLQPAFRPQSTRRLMGSVGSEASVFRERLAGWAATGEAFSMEEVAGRMLFEINARTIVGMPMGAQRGGSRVFEDMTFPATVRHEEANTWSPWRRIGLARKRRAALARSGAWLRETIVRRYGHLKKGDVEASDNILDNCLIERIQAEKEEGLQKLEQDGAWLDLLISNLRALMFGGQGTTNDTLCFILALLSVFPDELLHVREEHNRVAGPTFQDALDLLAKEPHRLAELEYTTAVIKETLRLFPVGFSAKFDDKTRDGFLELNGKRYPTMAPDTMVSTLSHTVHYDATYFPNPGRFEPARWLPGDKSPYPPPDPTAFRPFSRGARACMGRELAVDELRGILLCLLRWFDFALADLKPAATPRAPWTDLDLKLGDLAFQEIALEAKPRDGVMMKVRRTENEW